MKKSYHTAGELVISSDTENKDKIYFLKKDIAYWEDENDAFCNVCFVTDSLDELKESVSDWIKNVHFNGSKTCEINVDFKQDKVCDAIYVYSRNDSFYLKEIKQHKPSKTK